MSWNFVSFHEILNQWDAEKFQLSILKNKKVLFLKKIMRLVTNPDFRKQNFWFPE